VGGKSLCLSVKDKNMNTENLLDEIITEYDQDKVNILFELLDDEWLYFFFNEKNGTVASHRDKNIVKIVSVNKDNPITVPLIVNENGSNGVLYTNIDLAIKLAEFDCTVGKMKGKNVFDFYYGMENVDGVYIQGNSGNILSSWENLFQVGSLKK